MQQQYEQIFSNLNLELLHVYNSIVASVENKKSGIFFVYESGGCSKTFLWNTLCCGLWSG